jgi:antitoxin MazE
MRVKIAVQSWGNSLAICIPRAFAQEIRLGKGTEVDLQLKEGTLVISRERKKRYRLSDLLAKVRIGADQWAGRLGESRMPHKLVLSFALPVFPCCSALRCPSVTGMSERKSSLT